MLVVYTPTVELNVSSVFTIHCLNQTNKLDRGIYGYSVEVSPMAGLG